MQGGARGEKSERDRWPGEYRANLESSRVEEATSAPRFTTASYPRSDSYV